MKLEQVDRLVQRIQRRIRKRDARLGDQTHLRCFLGLELLANKTKKDKNQRSEALVKKNLHFSVFSSKNYFILILKIIQIRMCN